MISYAVWRLLQVLLERLEYDLERGTFYIVTPDKLSDLEHIAARLSLKRDAVMYGLPPLRHTKPHRAEYR
jgi:hypothetical protein